MTISSQSRGHIIIWEKRFLRTSKWIYQDNEKPLDDMRPCAKCKEHPTPEGYDACLEYVEGAEFACCGHGIEEPYSSYLEQS